MLRARALAETVVNNDPWFGDDNAELASAILAVFCTLGLDSGTSPYLAVSKAFAAGVLYHQIARYRDSEIAEELLAQNEEKQKPLADGNTARSAEREQSRRRAIEELFRRHSANPRTTKTSLLAAMAKEKQWGSKRTLTSYCKLINLSIDGQV